MALQEAKRFLIVPFHKPKNDRKGLHCPGFRTVQPLLSCFYISIKKGGP